MEKERKADKTKAPAKKVAKNPKDATKPVPKSKRVEDFKVPAPSMAPPKARGQKTGGCAGFGTPRPKELPRKSFREMAAAKAPSPPPLLEEEEEEENDDVVIIKD